MERFVLRLGHNFKKTLAGKTDSCFSFLWLGLIWLGLAGYVSAQRPEPGPIDHGDRSQPLIVLTFDACESSEQITGYDEAVVNILADTGTPATLFLGGLWLNHHSRQAQALAANPLFELGNHSWSHPDFTTLTSTEMSAEIEQTQRAIARLTGRQPNLFRFPAGRYSSEALAAVNGYGLQAIQWDVASGDPDPHLATQAIIEQVIRQARNGSIVVMHLNEASPHTAEALPTIIRQLRERGYTFVTVSQLLAGKAGRAGLNQGEQMLTARTFH